MPFRDPRGGNLAARIETEIRERIEEALDAACLDTLVRLREARRLPPPRADSPQDRTEYQSEIRRLLERLDAQLKGLARGPRPAPGPGQADRLAGLMETQIALARAVPDYWQRFDEVRVEYAAERMGSGGESRGLLRRLFGLG